MMIPSVVGIEDTSGLAMQLERVHGMAPVAWHAVDLNRVASRLSTSVLKRKGIAKPHAGFTWEADDVATDLWYPQGVTGLRRDDLNKQFHAISWYGKGRYEGKGVRLSLVDVADLDHIRYRHVLLVEPSSVGVAHPVYSPVLIHAGGLATRYNMIFVADSRHGVRVFDATKLFKADADPGKARCGIIGGHAYAYDYRYILPQTARYKLKGPPAFSFASMDWADVNAPQLLMGNYYNPPEYDCAPPTLSWWRLDGTTITMGVKQVVHSRKRVQGSVGLGDNVWLSCSGTPAQLLVGSASHDTFRSYTWPHGCEDLHYSPYSGNLWCQTEHPDERMVFAIRLTDYGP